MFSRPFIFTLMASAVALGLSGCETYDHVQNSVAIADKLYAENTAKVGIPAGASPTSDIINYMSSQYVSLDPVEVKNDAAATSGPALKCHIQIATVKPISILEAAQIITHECRAPVRVTPDALAQIQNPGGTGVSSDVKAVVPALAPVGGYGLNGTTNASLGNNLIDVNFDGEGDDFLNMITARFGGLSWKKMDGGVIKIYAMDTRTFAVSALATGDTTMSSNFQSGTTSTTGTSQSTSGGSSSSGSSGGSGSGGNDNTTMQSSAIALKSNIWGDLQSALTTIAGKGNIAVTPSTGSVTVRGNVDTLDEVGSYLKYQNRRLEKGVTFNVKVYSVTKTNNDSTGINWTAMYSTMAGKFGATLTGGATAATGAVTAGFNILSSSGSPWGGSQALINALDEQGRVKLEREQNLQTLNFSAVATQIGTQKGYLAGQTTSTTASVGTQTSIQLGTINVGFNLSLFPYIQDDNNILVQFNLNLSSLDNIRTITSGTSSAEAPNISLPLNTVQKVRVHPGETLVLTGMNSKDDNSDQTGTGWHWNWLLGGGATTTKTNTSLVVLITPVLTN